MCYYDDEFLIVPWLWAFALFQELKYPIERTSFHGIPILLLSKYRVFVKFRTIDNDDIGIPRNIEILIIMKSKFRESSQFWGYRHRSLEISRNSDIVIIKILKFRGIPTSMIKKFRTFAKFRGVGIFAKFREIKTHFW